MRIYICIKWESEEWGLKFATASKDKADEWMNSHPTRTDYYEFEL